MQINSVSINMIQIMNNFLFTYEIFFSNQHVKQDMEISYHLYLITKNKNDYNYNRHFYNVRLPL